MRLKNYPKVYSHNTTTIIILLNFLRIWLVDRIIYVYLLYKVVIRMPFLLTAFFPQIQCYMINIFPRC